jgi:hypothetical protein
MGCVLAGGFTATAIFAQPDQPMNPQPAAAVLSLTGQNSAHSGNSFWVFSDGENNYHQLQSQAHELAQKWVKADKDETKRDLSTKITDLLNQQFDLHSKQQQKELEDLEKQIAELRSVLRKRQDAKSAIVDRRLQQLLQDAQGLGWQSPSNPFITGHMPSIPSRHTLTPVPAVPPAPPAKAP